MDVCLKRSSVKRPVRVGKGCTKEIIPPLLAQGPELKVRRVRIADVWWIVEVIHFELVPEQ
jgi:hypothetical protein